MSTSCPLHRPVIRIFGAAILLLLAVASPPRAQGDEPVERGRELYLEHCSGCHGESGRGDGEKAKKLGFHPRDFTLGAFKCRSTPSGSPPTADDLTRVVSQGLKGTPMTGFADDLSGEEIAALVAHVRTLIPEAESTEPPVLEAPEPPPATPESVAEGRAIYGLLRCWKCHGTDGSGDGPSAAGLEDSWGNPIKVYDFTRRNHFKCGGTERDLYRTLHTGMTGSPMPSFTTAFPFGRDQVGRRGDLEQPLGEAATEAILDWLASQPTAAEIRAMDDSERHRLIESRTWALVDYLRSLAPR